MLHRRRILPRQSIFCHLCHNVLEDAQHVIISCSYAAQFVPTSLLALIQLLNASQEVNESKAQCAYMACQIWLARNGHLFQQAYAPPQHLVRKIVTDTLLLSQSSLTKTPLWHWDGHSSLLSNNNQIMVSWQTPPTGVIMIDFDASVDDSKAAAGFVIRDSTGLLLRAGGKLLPHSTVPYAELTAAWLGTYVARSEYQGQNIHSQGDSITVVKNYEW